MPQACIVASDGGVDSAILGHGKSPFWFANLKREFP